MRTIESSRFVSVLLLTSAACAGAASDGSGAPDVTVRDSAGIRIVESHVPSGVAPVYAELGDPDLEIGVVDGDPTYAFTRVIAVRALGGGSILVAEGGSQELRVFDATGSHVRTFGGRGSGPGEFSNMVRVAGLRGDTVRVWDGRNRRLSTFLTDGTLIGDISPTFDVSISPRGTYALDDGSLLVEAMDMPTGEWPSEPFQVTYVLRHMGTDGSTDTVAVLPGQHLNRGAPRMMTMPDGTRRSTEVYVPPLVDYQAYSVPSGERVFVGYNDHFRIDRRSPVGDLEMVIRVGDLERPLEVAEVDSMRQTSLDNCRATPEECERDLRERMDAFDLPELRPAYSRFLVDAGGRLWVAEWAHPGARVTGWHVFSTEGGLLGRVAIPAGLTVWDVQEDFVLGVIRNELNVPFVRRYPLTRLR